MSHASAAGSPKETQLLVGFRDRPEIGAAVDSGASALVRHGEVEGADQGLGDRQVALRAGKLERGENPV